MVGATKRRSVLSMHGRCGQASLCAIDACRCALSMHPHRRREVRCCPFFACRTWVGRIVAAGLLLVLPGAAEADSGRLRQPIFIGHPFRLS
jgi:hypothetical protein